MSDESADIRVGQLTGPITSESWNEDQDRIGARQPLTTTYHSSSLLVGKPFKSQSTYILDRLHRVSQRVPYVRVGTKVNLRYSEDVLPGLPLTTLRDRVSSLCIRWL